MSAKSTSPLISVIIPLYNLEKEIEECLQSLNHQSSSQTEYEVIIVDDASTDSSYNVAEKYKYALKNVTLIRRPSQGGPGMARNEGIKIASGDYLLFLDGDDLLPHWTIKNLVDAAKRENSDLITFNWSYCDSLKDSLSLTSHTPRRRDLGQITDNKDLLVRRYLGMCCDGSVIYTMARKSLFSERGIQFKAGLHEDIAVLFKMYYLGSSITVLDQVLYLKRNRLGSIVNTLSPSHIDGMLGAWWDMKQFLIERGGEALFDSYEAEYVSGVMGVLAVLLDKTFQILSNRQEQNEILSTIWERALYYFPEVVMGKNLPDITRYDKLAGSFVRTLSQNTHQILERASSFENIYKNSFSMQRAESI